MKINTPASSLYIKKNALPTKLLKPKNFKSTKLKAKQSSALGKKVESMKGHEEPNVNSLATIKTNLIKTILKENNSLTSRVKIKTKKDVGPTAKKSTLEQKKIVSSKLKPTEILNNQTAGINKIKGTHTVKKNSPKPRKLSKATSIPTVTTSSSKTSNNISISEGKKNNFQSKRKFNAKTTRTSKKVTKSVNKDPKKIDVKNLNLLNLKKVSSTVSSLSKLLKAKSQNKTELLDLEEPIFLQVECIKIPICPTKQLRFKLPHPLVNELSDVLLITADKKGSKIHPDKAVEHYTDLLDKHNVNFIQKVMPLRMLRQEYSQYEMKRKLVDQFDVILADANVLRSLPRILGGFALFSRKMPIAVHLDRQDLKQHLQTAISKTQMTVKSIGNISTVQVGHTKMAASKVAANIVEVSRCLAQVFPGGWPNVRSLNIKTTTSPTLPVYLSLESPNTVKPLVEVPKRPQPIEGELSTYPDRVVVIKPDGSIHLKKDEDALNQIESRFDDEIIQEAQKYIQASKTVRYESEEEEEEDNDAVEEHFLKNYEAAKQANAVDSDEENEEGEEEEEDEESDDDEPVLPISTTSKKRKMQPVSKQAAGKSPGKKQKLNTNSQQQKKPNVNKPGPVEAGKPQKRGTRAGKKNKMSKDQRKALIKRKKGGKK